MSKKLAAGSDAILLDVTMGDGAFMKDLDGALELARQMVAIGTAHGRKVAALITDMDKPLGHNIGNALEVAESMAVLQGKGPADLTEVCLQLAGNMQMCIRDRPNSVARWGISRSTIGLTHSMLFSTKFVGVV